MGAGWDQVRSRGPQFRSESGVDRIIRYLGGGALPAVLETVAVAVHLQDVNVVGEPVKQSAGEPLGAEHVGPLVEGQVGGDQDGAPFVALAEDLEAGIPQIKPTFLDIAPSGIPSNIIPHSKGVKCGLIRSNSPFSYSNHRPAKPKIPKPLVYAQVYPLGTSFATP